MMTFLWTTGGKEVHGRFINDNVIMRYYLDDATEPSLEFFSGAVSYAFTFTTTAWRFAPMCRCIVLALHAASHPTYALDTHRVPVLVK